MSFRRENSIYLLLLIPAFLLGGFFHVAFYGVDFLDAFCQIYYSILIIIWAISIKKRIIDKRICRMLLLAAGLILMVFTLQLCRYKLLGDDMTAIRYAWYGYYVPVIFIPYFLYRIALYIGTDEDENFRKSQIIVVFACSVLLTTMVLSNDAHQIVFKFPLGLEDGYNTYTYGIGFYLIYVWVAVIYTVSLIITLKKCRVMAVIKLMWIPLSLALLGGVGEMLIILGLLKFRGINIWQTGEFFSFWVFGFEEACIAIGLIPANVGYRKLLNFTNKLMAVSDSEGEIVYKSSKDIESFENIDNVLMFSNEISGGTVSWAVDMSKVFNLNRQIEDATEQIEARNEYLHTENDLKAERSKINARNDLYDNMAHLLRPQIDRIKELLREENDSEFDVNLRKISVLNAYIKRRSNMELMRDENDMLPLSELNMAINESCEYIKLCGVETMATSIADESVPAKMMILAYDFFENIVENTLESLKQLFITAAYSTGQLKLRLSVNATSFEIDGGWRKEDIDEFKGKVSVSKEDSDTVITLWLNT